MIENILKRKHAWKQLKITGASPKLYFKLLRTQKGKCAICGKHPQRRGLAVDHNHKTGVIRGLLCIRCNVCLGWLENVLSIPGKLDEIRDSYLHNNWDIGDFPNVDDEDEIFDSKRPNVALKRARVIDRMTEIAKDHPDLGMADLTRMTAQECGLSTRTVQRYIYDKNRKGV
jgi:recombination endonuclease VII